MDPTALFKEYATKFGIGHPYTQMQAGDTSYGPAVTRITQTPVDFTQHMVHSGDNGEYYPDTNRIAVNPLESSNVPETVRHESIHALLNFILPAHAKQLVESSPNYDTIASKIYNMSKGSAEPWSEAAAYMGESPRSQILGVTDQQHDQFLQGLRDQLSAVHPQLGATLQKLMDSGKRPIPQGPSSNFNNYTGQ